MNENISSKIRTYFAPMTIYKDPNSTDSLFAEHPVLTLSSEKKEKRVRCGNPITMPGTPDGTYRVCGQNGEFLCLSRAESGTLTSIKNFFGA